ncbi:MAG: iron export ABC transporter permease subunit FetB [Desulfobacteraceae bacterium]|jgi:putative ABC transport system permease protein
MTVVTLTPVDLSLAAGLVLLLALLSVQMRLGMTRQIIIAALRTTVQLLLIGLVLKTLFSNVHLGWIGLMAAVMLLAAGREVMGRQKRKFKGLWGFGVGTLSMFISSFTITVLALNVIISVKPWYLPQYAIPLLGMLLGNTMSGIAIGLDRLTAAAWDHRTVIEGRLMLGAPWSQAINSIRRDSIRSGLIPIINSMMAAGLVSLPGMMTGQILGGNPPMEAVKYQILIMFLIAGGTGLGTIVAVWMGSRRLFDGRQRLRLDRLRK